MFPSGPAVMPAGAELGVETGNSVITPAVVIRPILFAEISVNQRFPSDPAAIPTGKLPAVGMENSVISPAVVIRPILSSLDDKKSANQRFPSGPAVMP